MPRNEKITISTKIGKLIDDLLKSLGSDTIKQKIKSYIRERYNKGLDIAEDLLDQNFNQDKEDLNFLLSYVNGVVGNTTDQINKDLRGIMDRGIAEGADLSSIKSSIKEEFKTKKYIDRYKTVIRTEGLRAENNASLNSAKQLKFKVKKYLDVVEDDRTSNICHAEHAKYGSKEEAIDLDDDFIVEVDNKTFRAQAPPFHQNCRSILRYVEVDEE